MNIAFTLCSNNYLSQAKVLADSFLKYHADFKFVIGLVDGYSEDIDYDFFKNISILTVDQVPIPDFKLMEEKYNIVELNTAVKPFYFSYFFNKNNADKVLYLDPDIQVFSPFVELINLLDTYNIVITPQACTPIDDEFAPTDAHLLATGVFNLGFIGLSKYETVKTFLKWWSDRLVKYCFDNPSGNMFFDQLWINLVPVFFENYYILKNYGYNMAAWNMHERTITKYSPDNITINENIPLRFFHYSGYKFSDPSKIVRYSDRFTFQSRPDVVELFKNYYDLVINSNYLQYSKVTPIYCKPKLKPKVSTLKRVKNKMKRMLPAF